MPNLYSWPISQHNTACRPNRVRPGLSGLGLDRGRRSIQCFCCGKTVRYSCNKKKTSSKKLSTTTLPKDDIASLTARHVWIPPAWLQNSRPNYGATTTELAMNTGIPGMTCGPVNRRPFTGVRDRVRQANLRHGTMGEARPEVSLSCVRYCGVPPQYSTSRKSESSRSVLAHGTDSIGALYYVHSGFMLWSD